MKRFSTEKLKSIKYGSFKYYVRYNVFKNYKGSNKFSLESMAAYSYSWWKFFEKNPKVGYVFNNYSYSNQTAKHQQQLRYVLRELGITVDHYIECPKGLGDLSSAIKYQYYKYFEVQSQVLNPRRVKRLDAERTALAETYLDKIKTLRLMGAQISRQDIEMIGAQVEDALINKYIREQANQADLESITQRITLNGDAMVNLDRGTLEFRGTGLDQWSCDVSTIQKRDFYTLNGLTEDWNKKIRSWDSETRSYDIWGRVDTLSLDQAA